jgi:amino acid adenylation domain-containing protein
MACIHELFEGQAHRSADAIALRCNRDQVTYGDLNARANQLARYLRQLGVGVETRIGLCVDRPLDAVVAVIAALKAGGTYLTVARNDPPQRSSKLIRASRMQYLIATTALEPRLDIEGVHRICLDEAAPLIALQSRDNVQSGTVPDNLAYIRYTSGSSGAPKGVMNTHRSMVSRLTSAPLPDVHADDICGATIARGFGSRLYYPLIVGTTVVIIPDDHFNDPARLAREVSTHRITSLYMVPSLLRAILNLDAAVVRQFAAMRALAVGGEALMPDLIDRFRAALPDVLLIDMYGSSEIGTTAAIRLIGSREVSAAARPVFGTRLHVLDDTMNHEPPGMVGEVYVASPHLTRGYLDAPAYSAERCLPDPFAAEPGTRMYRTGDLGRAHADGVEFVGRADRQVKIRGFRVELGEIESVLLGCERIQDATVTAMRVAAPVGTSGGPENDEVPTRLIAYVVKGSGAPLGISELRAYVQARLPDYMVPSVFVAMDKLPLMADGKVDRNALPLPSATRPDLQTPYAAPRVPLEAALAELWADALGLDQVGIDDDFLELGGDSLAAATVTARLEERFHVSIPAVRMFERSTVAMLAKEIASDGLLTVN